METKSVRENRNMRKIALVSVVMLVVCVGYSVAGASVLNLKIELSNTSVLAGTDVTYTVYGKVTDNFYDYETGSGDPTSGYDLTGGLFLYYLDMKFSSSNGGVAQQDKSTAKNDGFHASAIQVAPFNVGLKQAGTLLGPAPTYAPSTLATMSSTDGQGGMQSIQGSQDINNVGGWSYAVAEGATNTDVNVAAEVWAPLFSGTIHTLTAGTVNISLLGNPEGPDSNRVYALDYFNGLTTETVDSIVMDAASQNLTITGGNTGPSVSIPGGDVLEEDWSKEPGWNNLLHAVDITAVGTDPEEDSLTYEWKMTGGGKTDQVLTGETGSVLNLTLQKLSDLGFILPTGGENWSLSVTAFDGALTSAPAGIDVFVPEPATLGLLAFGVVGLLRRRRRA
jgi:hypothetical protein